MNAINTLEHLAPDTFRFYRQAIDIMHAGRVPFMVGGAYAFAHYTGIVRHTKDFDLFIHRVDLDRAMAAFQAVGYRSELLFTHWLAKVYHGDDFVDIIFSSGNGLCAVDDHWFRHAPEAEVMGRRVALIPTEEMIWQKAYIMERERFDGADVNHLLRACGARLNWDRLLGRFGPHWQVLLAHLIAFGFVYPNEHHSIPESLLGVLTSRLHHLREEAGNDRMCRGTLLSRTQYLTDTEEWGYADPRVEPCGPMTANQVIAWTDAGR
jgi:hypothetical protein